MIFKKCQLTPVKMGRVRSLISFFFFFFFSNKRTRRCIQYYIHKIRDAIRNLLFYHGKSRESRGNV